MLLMLILMLLVKKYACVCVINYSKYNMHAINLITMAVETDLPCAWKSSFSVLSWGESALLARWWLLCKASVSYDKPS